MLGEQECYTPNGPNGNQTLEDTIKALQRGKHRLASQKKQQQQILKAHLVWALSCCATGLVSTIRACFPTEQREWTNADLALS